MKLLVLGATGGTGREIVSQALALSHEVTVLVRDPRKIRESHLRIVQGDAADESAVAGAVAGQDAVLSSLGRGNSLRSDNLFARTLPAIVGAMEKQGVRRLVVVSAHGVGDTGRGAPVLTRLIHRLMLADVFADKLAGEQAIRRSGLDWTIVYPTILTHGVRTPNYRHAERLELRGLPSISRADVADFVLRQLGDAAYVRKGAVVSQ